MNHVYECWAGRPGECRGGCSCPCHPAAESAEALIAFWLSRNAASIQPGSPTLNRSNAANLIATLRAYGYAVLYPTEAS